MIPVSSASWLFENCGIGLRPAGGPRCCSSSSAVSGAHGTGEYYLLPFTCNVIITLLLITFDIPGGDDDSLKRTFCGEAAWRGNKGGGGLHPARAMIYNPGIVPLIPSSLLSVLRRPPGEAAKASLWWRKNRFM